jgi:dolichol kinase
MLFAKASKSLLTKPRLASTVGQRLKSTTADAASESSGSGSLAAAVATTFVTYMTADFLSNFLQHPTQKVCFSGMTSQTCFS